MAPKQAVFLGRGEFVRRGQLWGPCRRLERPRVEPAGGCPGRRGLAALKEWRPTTLPRACRERSERQLPLEDPTRLARLLAHAAAAEAVRRRRRRLAE